MYDCSLFLSAAYWPSSLTHRGFCDEATLNPDPPLGIKLICSCSPSRPLRVYSHAKNWEQEGEDRGIRLCKILKHHRKISAFCQLWGVDISWSNKSKFFSLIKSKANAAKIIPIVNLQKVTFISFCDPLPPARAVAERCRQFMSTDTGIGCCTALPPSHVCLCCTDVPIWYRYWDSRIRGCTELGYLNKVNRNNTMIQSSDEMKWNVCSYLIILLLLFLLFQKKSPFHVDGGSV